MRHRKRLEALEATRLEPEPATLPPLTPGAIEAAARAILYRAEAGTLTDEIRAALPELLASEHVSEALKEGLRRL